MNDALPDNGGYVAAAYLVFLVLVLVYVVILGMRLSRMERDLAELEDLAPQADGDGAPSRERASA